VVFSSSPPVTAWLSPAPVTLIKLPLPRLRDGSGCVGDKNILNVHTFQEDALFWCVHFSCLVTTFHSGSPPARGSIPSVDALISFSPRCRSTTREQRLSSILLSPSTDRDAGMSIMLNAVENSGSQTHIRSTHGCCKIEKPKTPRASVYFRKNGSGFNFCLSFALITDKIVFDCSTTLSVARALTRQTRLP